MISFWQWLIKGSGNRPGLYRYFDRWILLHILVGAVMAHILPITLKEASTSLLLPVASILIGLSFAWGGNAQALLQTEEIENISSYKKGGFEDYVYTFQSAIFLILVTLFFWALAGLNIFDSVWPTCSNKIWYRLLIGLIFFLSSMTLRECWHVVLGAQQLLLMRFNARKNRK
ncbi:MAG: hypothetical protein D6732_03225 [Methanobacteriota archaeon]|nr:MAG: hypothetical protein D6732_03225 [Euryarchaeota archaeon]